MSNMAMSKVFGWFIILAGIVMLFLILVSVVSADPLQNQTTNFTIAETNLSGVFQAPVNFDYGVANISGTINGTMPVQLTMSGNVSVISLPVAWDDFFEMIELATICLVIIAVCMLALTLFVIFKLRRIYKVLRRIP